MSARQTKRETGKSEVPCFLNAGRSEAQRRQAEATEANMARPEYESLATGMMPEILEKENLAKALKRVMENKGAPGVDGMTVDELPSFLEARWPEIEEKLKQGSYKPEAVKRVEIPKPGGRKRMLGIPTVVDRYIQQAVQQILQKHLDETFSENSYGFRPGKSAHQAIRQAQKHIASGHQYVVDMDLERFFDRVNHDVLMDRLAKRVKDKLVLKLIRAYLNAGIMENGIYRANEQGTPQGGPLSPFLSNVLLDELDRKLERRGLRFVRYADDCNIYVKSERAGKRVLESMSRFLEKRLRLKVNQEKSGVGRVWERKFLGFTFTYGKEQRRRIAPEAIRRMKEKVRKLTSRNRGASLNTVIQDLGKYLKGWKGYFGFCETRSQLRDLDGWIRRRLRSLIWKQWKDPYTRYTRLRALGLCDTQARRGSGTHGPWRMGIIPPLRMALSKAYFNALGLVELNTPA
jgi:RNA-directed DNA polymerase